MQKLDSSHGKEPLVVISRRYKYLVKSRCLAGHKSIDVYTNKEPNQGTLDKSSLREELSRRTSIRNDETTASRFGFVQRAPCSLCASIRTIKHLRARSSLAVRGSRKTILWHRHRNKQLQRRPVPRHTQRPQRVWPNHPRKLSEMGNHPTPAGAIRLQQFGHGSRQSQNQ